ncbi:hypothetical protein DOM22_18125 [Bdellovibrio sp. ZAP7]|uniref:beta-sandwich domain-containing protein n=1 Tax=Bdellovibrio sp. ZAP7 TaxID=2231053 RepID=UPI00115ACF66|nr:beta-sandwich domain-containing protein [Bdellovibrio sp. ZAP7]QDK46937.1 hypothetical protein DOM22_18125 [Bdellovibrio sp. ZAP7]
MKKALLSLAAVVLSFSLIARADNIEDLPDLDPGSESGSPGNQYPTPLPPPPPPSEPSTPASEAGTLRISNVSRASGGTVYRISVRPGVVIQRVSIRVNGGKVVISGARVNTTPVRNLVSPDILTAGAAMSSEYLNERVFTIDLRMEAYGGEADVTVLVSSDERWPQLSLSDVFPPQPPAPGPGNPPRPPPPSSAGPLRAGDAVISGGGSNYYTGQVVAVYDNGQVVVRDDDDGKTYVRSSAVVFKKIQCATSKRLCIGQDVLTYGGSNGYLGKIVGAYTNGLVAVRDNDDGRRYFRKTDVVFASVNCFDGKCVGEYVISGSSSKYYSGRIVNIWENGIFQVRDDDDSRAYFRRTDVIKKSIRCERSKGICQGDRVMSGGGSRYYLGVVVGVYQSGVIAVRDDDDGRVYYRSVDVISKRVN